MSDVEKTPTKSVPSTEHDEPPTKRIAPAPAPASEGGPTKSTFTPGAHDCLYCIYKAADHNSLNKHNENVHQKFDCILCKATFNTEDDRLDHIDEQHSHIYLSPVTFTATL